MTRPELEHVLRAAGAIAEVHDVVVIGSQAILGSVATPPPELTVSLEADVYPLRHPERADLIDGSIGEKSLFHDTFGYYAHGIGPETAILPSGWQQRLVRFESHNTGGVVAWCLSPIDIAASKLAAGRDKDRRYVQVLLRSGLISLDELQSLLQHMPDTHRDVVATRLQAWTRPPTS